MTVKWGEKKYEPVPRVYIQLRVYDYAKKAIKHVKGKTIIVERTTPEAVHALIVGALKEAHERARKAKQDGEKAAGQEDQTAGRSAGRDGGDPGAAGD